ncbi:hypothetical protein ACFVVU_10050 [Kitasatospora sp. NPDC057965]|uniref:DUF7507 domain-containing protein n=1 Tax=Kitasatospora sp. NPDC057965 TaxID=3346291 RepID=UPI0036D8893A
MTVRPEPRLRRPLRRAAPGAVAVAAVLAVGVPSGTASGTSAAPSPGRATTATASASASATATATATATGSARRPDLTLTKTATPAIVTGAGQTVTFTLRVTNTGNAPLTGVSVKDTAFTGEGAAPVISCPSTALAREASMTCTATYVITGPDLKQGRVDNTSVAIAKAPDGSTVTSAPASAAVTAGLVGRPPGSPSPSPSRTATASHHLTHVPSRTHAAVPPTTGEPSAEHALAETGAGTRTLLAAVGAALLIAAGTPLLLAARRARRRD